MNEKEFKQFVYDQKSFIEKLRLESKEEQIVQVFKYHYPELDVSYTYENSIMAKLRFKKQTRNGVAWRIYSLTDFNCVITDDYANCDERSVAMCSDDNIKKIYIGFMSQTFSTYRDKFKKHLYQLNSQRSI